MKLLMQKQTWHHRQQERTKRGTVSTEARKGGWAAYGRAQFREESGFSPRGNGKDLASGGKRGDFALRGPTTHASREIIHKAIGVKNSGREVCEIQMS